MDNSTPRPKKQAAGKSPGLTALLIEEARRYPKPRLSFRFEKITQLPESIGELEWLEELTLTDNRLSTLPESITGLEGLSILHLTRNRLVELPEQIGRLSQLRHLCLRFNRLTSLPESFGRLKQLRELLLGGNKLKRLPEPICRLRQLRKLDLTGAGLVELPESIRNLKGLKELYLHDNSLLGLPSELLGPTMSDVTEKNAKPANAADILEYYFRVRGGRRPLNEAKLLLVGRGAVGKTSIVNRLIHDTFKDEGKTEGINISEWGLRLGGTEYVRLHVWDFGGQEIMHATHQFFLTERSLYLLVLNGREGGEDADAEYWLKLIQSFGGDSPVVVVLNKIKEHPFDVNRNALQ